MLPATRSRSDGALDAALERLGGRDVDRPDTPDLHVTAVRRLPAVAAQFAPFPDALDPRLDARRSPSRGVEQLYTHQARGDRARARRPQRRRHHADGVGQDALLQRAGAERDPAGSVEPRALPVSDQGARAGSARRAAGDVRDDRRARPASRSACSPTTATRRRTRGARSARARTSCSAIPDMVHSGILPHHPRWAKLFENLRYVIIDELHAYRGVFGSHLVQRAAAAAAHLPALRIESGVPLLVGDDCQPARAGRAADRAAVRAGRQERRAARREVLRLRQPAGRQPSARHPAVVSRRDAAHRVGVPQAQPAAHRLRAEPARRPRS